MTNKEFRSDLAKEMRDKYNERNEKLGQVEKSSFSDGLKGQMRKEIMENFNKEMDEMKSRPGYEEARRTHLEEIKAKIKLAKSKKEKERLQKEYEERLAEADADITDSEKAYEEAQIQHRGRIEDDGNVSENGEIPQELKDYREAWKERIGSISDDTKEKIVKAAEKINVNVETESDGSRLIEFEVGGKKWKILDPKLDRHTYGDYHYVYHNVGYSITHINEKNVRLRGMMGDNVNNWENKPLANYVNEKQKEGLHIPSEKEMKELLSELGRKINLNESEQIAMLMYLTGMDGFYRLSSINGGSSRSMLCFSPDERVFLGIAGNNDNDDFAAASLCMIACE